MYEMHMDEEDLAAYSLGALPAFEARRVGGHLSECPTCRLQAEEFSAVVALLPYGVPQIDPPAHLEQRVMRALEPRRAWRVPPWGIWAAAATLVAAVGAGAWGAGRTWHRPGPVAVVQTHAMRLVGTAMAPRASARLMMLHTDSGVLKIVLEAQGLPPLQGNATYTMWMVKADRRWNCGSFRVDERGNGMLAYDWWSYDDFDQVGVTMEPEPNQSDKPNGAKVLGLVT